MEKTISDKYVIQTRKIAQSFKKHHFQISRKYQLVGVIHYFKMTKEKYLWCYKSGACGLGHFSSPLIKFHSKNTSNIVHFICGSHHSLFLDSEENVFSVGAFGFGQLGLGQNTNQNVLNKIPNIPPIKIISCALASSYLIDFEGKLWTFGANDEGQLDYGDKIDKNAPKINTLKNIQQISYGCIYFFCQKFSRANICHWE